jgi:GTP-binding protein
VLIDLAAVDGLPPAEQEEILLRELGAYEPELLTRPRLIVGNKIDIAEPSVVAGWEGLTMSGVTQQGVRNVVGKLAQLVFEARNQEPVREAKVILRPEPKGTYIERLGEGSSAFTVATLSVRWPLTMSPHQKR